jgi:hypothetical protein
MSATRHSPARLACPLWVNSGHFAAQSQCPPYPRKRTLFGECFYGFEIDATSSTFAAHLGCSFAIGPRISSVSGRVLFFPDAIL